MAPSYNKLASLGYSRRLSGLAALLVSLFLLGRLAGSVHLAVVEHGLCPEDGELVHAGEIHAPAAVAKLTPSLPQLRAGCACTETHQHDHCVSAAQRQQQLLRPLGTTAQPLPTPPATPSPSPPPLATVQPSLRIFRLAPKNSPPV